MGVLRCWLVIVPVLVALLGIGGCADTSSLRAERLMCEARVDPEGIAAARPRLSWRLATADASARGQSVSAYRVEAAASVDAFGRGEPLVWDSGLVKRDGEAPLAMRAEWGGRALASRDRVWWRVKVWDQLGREGAWSEPARFSVGLLRPEDWRAEWIGLEDRPQPPLTAQVREQLRRMPWIRQPGGPERCERVSYFRKEFDLPGDAPVESAWIAGTADMIGQVTVNGRAVGELARWEMLRPIDVSGAIRAGKNAVGVRVEQHDGFNPAVTGVLAVRFVGGREQRVPIDGSWVRSAAAADGWDTAGFDASAWKKVEVSGGAAWGSNRNTEHFMARAPYLRAAFVVPEGKRVVRATLYASALGLYECQLNGAVVGGGWAEFAPGWTEYAKRVEHRTYEVTSMVHSGENCLGAVVGDGWYAGLMGYTGRRRFYDGPARFMGQLEVEYGDGTREVVATGPSWKASFGSILHTDNYLGTEVDSRVQMQGWSRPGFDDRGWQAAEVGLKRRADVRQADVTARVRSAVRSGQVSMPVNPEMLGDPAYGVVKRLRVEYAVGSERHEVMLKEGEVLMLPRPGESGELAITRATFGEQPPAELPAPVVEPAMGDPVTRFVELPALKLTEPRRGRYVFDLGQNMVGWAKLKVSGAPGQRLTVRHAEMLNPDGTLYTSNLRGATATDFYTLKGGDEVLEPPFTFHGFRYVEVTGLMSPPGLGMVTGVVAHSAMRPAGTFTSSSELLNRLVKNIEWGQRGNYLEVPTDCPQRDERLGWTGDAQFFIDTAAYGFDIRAFMERWLKTLAQDAQFDDGTFAHVAPKANERGGSTAWGDAAIVCAHELYLAYGETRVIEANWDAMKRYMAWLDGKTKDGVSHVGGFGDWLNLDDPTQSDLIDTAYRVQLCDMMARMGRAIGKAEDAAAFARTSEETLRVFNERFVAEDGSLRKSGQTGYALAFTMLPRMPRSSGAMGNHFERSIRVKNDHLATGFIGTPRLLPALHKSGNDELAAKLLLTEDYPSWLYQVRLGATTMWERWDGWTPERGFSDVGMNSFNHYAFGSVGNYLYRHVAGIAPLEPGYARVLIAPTPTAGLDHAAAAYDSVAGLIKSGWKRTGGGIEYAISVPVNVTAEIRLRVPDGCAVTEGGAPAEAARGISGAELQAGELCMTAQPGEYVFRVVPR